MNEIGRKKKKEKVENKNMGKKPHKNQMSFYCNFRTDSIYMNERKLYSL